MKLLDKAIEVDVDELWENMVVAREMKQAVLILGAPGIGKSQLTKKFAEVTPPSPAALKQLKAMGCPPRNHLAYHETRFSYAAPTDLRGWPNLTKDSMNRPRMSFAIPIDYPMEPGSVWNLEELLCGSPETLKAGLQLFLELRIGEYACPEDTTIIASANRLQDYADVETLNAPLMDRLMLLTLRMDHKKWVRWAIQKPLDHRVIAFNIFFPNLLHTLPVKGVNGVTEDWDGISQFSTPRSWEAVSRYLQCGGEKLSKNARLAGIAGLTGNVAGTQFDLFLEAEKSLPSRDEIVRHPSTAPMPDPKDISAQACLCTALASSMERDNCDAYIKYLRRLPNKDFFPYALQYASVLRPEVMTYPAFMREISENQKLFSYFGT